jgi:hypothetical protein
MTVILWLGLALGAIAALAIGLGFWGAARWADSLRRLRARLEDGRVPPTITRYDARELDGLPAPVQRYFRAVLTDGLPIITAVSFEMAGSFNLSATGEQWKAFTSRQQVSIHRPGFVWDARIAMLPGLTVRVVDGYIAGRGLLRAAIMGLFTVAEQSGDGEIARGEFMRYFAEMVWYPTALLPSQGVRWAGLDAHSANATFTDGPLTLTLLFRFNDAGLIESFRAEARGGMVGKEMVMAPWEGSFSDYQMRDGMTVPTFGEVAWLRPDGRKPYFRGTVTALSYAFSP